ncbi:MAG: DUF362 domain-containing protein [Candidatus Thermoplasmatota archaeon]|nr:DUF362 domain-containing protein [Candidatus Thermoplasmatota archaeon]
MNKVVFFNDLTLLPKVMKSIGVSKFANQKVLVKLHMGEVKNKYFPRPEYVRQHIDILKGIQADPFLYDTTVVYKSPRKFKTGYQKVAKLHGFTKKKVGCDVVIDDKGIYVEVEGNDFEVGETLHDATHVLSLSHVKGHIATGMGGAIKNFGMGGVTSETKRWIHHGSKPAYNKDNCTYCGVCAEVCPFHAISLNDSSWKCNEHSCFGCGVCVHNCKFEGLTYQRYDLQYTLACAAKACVNNKNVLYVNEVKRIAKSCDCDPFAGPIICPDIGYVASDDIVAVDKASLDLINKVKPGLFKKIHQVDPEKQIKYAEEIDLGFSDYELVSL